MQSEINLPHCPPIRMIDVLDSADELLFTSHMTVPVDSPYVVKGQLCPEMLLEVMAQCFAAGLRYRQKYRSEEGARVSSWGYLVSIRNFKVTAKIYSGDILSARCELAMKVGPIWVVNGRVERARTETASAQFKIYISEA